MDCLAIEASLPIRQGDVLKRLHDGHGPQFAVVVSADCDIANNKLTDAGLVCVHVSPLRDYVLFDHARSHARRQLERRYQQFEAWVNKRWLQQSPGNTRLDSQHIRAWLTDAPIEELEQALGVLPDPKPSFVRVEKAVLAKAEECIAADGPHAGVDCLRALQAKAVSRSEQVRSLFQSLAPNNLPLDVFFVSSIPGEPGVGYFAKLRSLFFLPLHDAYTSQALARQHQNPYLRVGRLDATYRHAMAQQFGMLFARIGFTAAYESDRDAVFAVVADDLNSEMEAQK